MGFFVRWPDGFVPEEHGWERPDVNADMAIWLRWEPPFKYPASIAQCVRDKATGAVGGLYMPPEGRGPDQMTQGQIHKEMLGRVS